MSIEKRGNTYYKRERQAGRDVRFALKTADLNEAIRRDGETAGMDSLPTFADAAEHYEKRPEGINPTDALYLKRLCAVFGEIPLADLGPSRIDALWTQPRLAKGIKPGSVRRELATMAAVLNHAHLFELIKTPIRVRKPRADDARNHWVTAAERDRMIAAATPEAFQSLVAAAFYTGARQGELLAAVEAHYDGRSIQFATRKTGGKGVAYRRVPVHPALKPYIKPRNGVLFPSPWGRKWSRSEVRRQWLDLVEKTGHPEMRFHDCRHTFASLMVQSGVDLITLASITGHKTITMLNRYSHLNDDAQMKAIMGAL